MDRLNYRGWFTVILVTLLIEILSRTGILYSGSIPPMSDILLALVRGIISGELSSQIVYTLQAYAEGFVLAVVVGGLLGLLLGKIPILRDALTMTIEMLRPIPSVAIIPIAILVFGLGVTMRVSVIFYAASWPMMLNTIHGVLSVEPLSIDTAKSFGFTNRDILWTVTLPAALPSIVTGMRISSAIALVLAVTSEMIAGINGIGFYAAYAESTMRPQDMYAAIIFTGLLGFLLNKLFLQIEKRTLAWHYKLKT